LLLAGVVTIVGSGPLSAAVPCSVDYEIINEWPNGFQGSVTISNNGPAASSWTLQFDLPNGQSVQHGWAGQWSQTGSAVTVESESWNGNLASGQSVTIGYIGAHSGAAVAPDSFTLNGDDCDTDGDTTTTTVGSTTTTTQVSTTSTTQGSTTTTGPSTTTTDPSTTTTSIPPGEYEPRQANPFNGLAGWYVNPLWSARAAASGGAAVADQPTAVWLDTIGAIEGDPGSVSLGAWGLERHLDEALDQQAAAGGGPFVFEFVTYNLPARDCAALASNGELGIDELDRYQSEYIDEIDAIISQPKYASLRIVSIIEIDSLPNLVTNVSGAGATLLCAQVQQSGVYVDGIRYAIDAYSDVPNVYSYLDAAHHGWIGWDDNRSASATLLAGTVLGSDSNGSGVAGFITNTANYSALREVNIPFPLSTDIRPTPWIDFNVFADELTFAQTFRQDLINAGMSSDIGFLIDTSRNGWGGADRPADGATGSIDDIRIDRRIHAGNWCNQSGAGLGERPQASPEPGIDAYVWVKPPGESDGSSELIPQGPDNPDGKGFDEMCDPSYGGNARNGNNLSGALPNAPVSGAWFEAQFQELVANAYPPLG
jgi:cellulose 1,4-beta-cellobiosidase